MWFVLTFSFALGMVAGSFLSVVADRVPRGESIAGRSYCPWCKKKLTWMELIPVASYFFLRGRCRSCLRPIPWKHPIIEAISGVLFIAVAWSALNISGTPNGSSFFEFLNPQFLLVLSYGLFVTSVLIVVFLSDLIYYIIPDRVMLPAIGVALGANIFQDFFAFRLPHNPLMSTLPNSFLTQSVIASGIAAAVLAAGFFFLLIIVSSGRWMGMGDAKFGIFMGLVIGWPGIIPALFSSFLFGSAVALPLLVFGQKTMKSFLPFGTFLAVSTLVWLLYGAELTRWTFATFVGL